MAAWVRGWRVLPVWLRAALVFCVALTVGLMFALGHFYPDAPVYEQAGAYVSKWGRAHTRESYEAYVWLHRAMLVSGLLLLVAFATTLFYPPPAD